MTQIPPFCHLFYSSICSTSRWLAEIQVSYLIEDLEIYDADQMSRLNFRTSQEWGTTVLNCRRPSRTSLGAPQRQLVHRWKLSVDSATIVNSPNIHWDVCVFIFIHTPSICHTTMKAHVSTFKHITTMTESIFRWLKMTLYSLELPPHAQRGSNSKLEC